MAGENASEFPSSSCSASSSSSSQMSSSSLNSRPGSSRRRSLLKDAEVWSQKQLYRQSLQEGENEATPIYADKEPQKTMSNSLLQRHSSYSLHSSSSSGDSRPPSSSRKKIENGPNNRPATRDRHLPRPNSWQRSSSKEHLQRRPSTANSYSGDSEDESSPRYVQSKSSLSKYKPLPAIRGKKRGASSPDILKIPTDSQMEDIATHTQNNNSLSNPESLTMGLKRESSLLSDGDYSKEATKHLPDVRLDLKGSSPQPIQDEIYEALLTPIDLPVEPGPEEARILLAVKLPTGRRVHRFFRLTDPLLLVRQFAEVSSSCNFARFQLAKSVPREILDLKRTIEENDLPEKMLLHLEIYPQNGNQKFTNSS